MYAGVIFAIIGVALWLGAYQLSGYGRLSSVRSCYSSRGRLVGDSCATVKVIWLSMRAANSESFGLAELEMTALLFRS